MTRPRIVALGVRSITVHHLPRAALPTVALLTDSRDPSGLGEHMLTLAAALAGRARVRLAVPPEAAYLAARARAAGFEARADLDLEWLAGVEFAHVHAGVQWEGLALAAAARRVADVVVRTEHLPWVVTEPADADAYHAGDTGDLTICVSAAARDTLAAVGVPRARLRVVRNGIADIAPVEPTALAIAGPRLLVVGRLTIQKGHDVLIRALADVPGASLLVAGVGFEEPALRVLADAVGVADRVHWLGLRDDVPALMVAADLVVLPSRFEGLPLVALEAMRAARAVVAAAVSGCAEAVAHGETGLLVPADDPPALAAALGALLADPARRAAMGAAGRTRYAAVFTADRMGEQTMDVYNEALAMARAGTERRRA